MVMDLDNLSTFDGNDEDKLINFLKQTYNFVEYLYKNSSDFVPKDMLLEKELILGAWNEFDENFNFKEEENKIRSASDNMLADHGLKDTQLELKLTIIEKFYNLWNSNKSSTKFLKKLINAIDNLLDSLIEALGIDGALKELKDAYSTLLD